MKTTEPFQFGGFLLRLCFPDFLAIFFADFPFNLHTSSYIGTLFDSPGKFSIFSTKLDFSRTLIYDERAFLFDKLLNVLHEELPVVVHQQVQVDPLPPIE
jgi:hypothetical protein